MQKLLEKDVSTLRLDKPVAVKLKENDINTVFDLCKFSRMELSDLGFPNSQISSISIELQLLGVDLKKNHAKRNTSVDAFL